MDTCKIAPASGIYQYTAINGKTPSQIDSELSSKTPLNEEVAYLYDINKEHIQNPVYQKERG